MFARLRHAMVTIRCPDPDGMFRTQDGRLAQFRPRAVLESYWTNHWKDEQRRKKLLKDRRASELKEYEALFAKYMPKHGLVLEAGCGLGQKVSALAARGYQVRGIEYDAEVVAFVKAEFPDLDVRHGDVHALSEPDASVQTYLSFGVLEHFANGPIPAMREVRRVLALDGFALIMVPLLNAPRATYLSELARGDELRTDEALAFYQYYFTVDEFTALAASAGLEVVDWAGLFPSTHLIHEHPLVSRLWRSRLGRSRLRAPMGRALDELPGWAKRRYGHMAMYVCRRA